jgi:hypothetical protein
LADRKAMLHSDNGSSVKGTMMLATLEKSGAVLSFKSNDNAFAQALSRIHKCRPNCRRKPLDTVDEVCRPLNLCSGTTIGQARQPEFCDASTAPQWLGAGDSAPT